MQDDRRAAILERLRNEGGRITRTRELVIDALLASPDHHLTAPEVVAAVRAVDPDFYESTVYRTLDRLVELGVVERVHLGPGPAVLHLPGPEEHHHLVCERCGAVLEAEGDLLDTVAERLRREHGFRLREAGLALRGTCAACAGDGG